LRVPAENLSSRPWFWASLAALLYGGLHLIWYWQTPLGQVAVLDERENLDLARQIATGSLPAEPFYRAMGYPLLLALLPSSGVPPALLPFAATALGLLLHALNSLLLATIAGQVFSSTRSALIAGLLHALNPALIHYATQILDGTLANTCFLLGLLALFPRQTSPARTDGPTPATTALLVASWTAATLVRPQFALLLPTIPLLWWLAAPGPIQHARYAACTGLAALAALLLAQGLWQKSITGEFRLSPTQGAYNLWAANRPGADGRYFIQTLHLPATDPHQNPTRLESIILYQHETGQSGAPIDAVNAYWSARLRTALAADPVGWLKLTARKVYYLFNNFDAYNNKTLGFHQARSPWLAPNPLSWGVLIMLATAGAAALAHQRPRLLWLLAAAFITLTAGIVLTYVSGRFRLPLTALLCLVAGGTAHLNVIPPARRLFPLLLIIAFGALTFSRFAGANDTRTYLQDHLLLASASVATGDDPLAWHSAGEALQLSPGHPDALTWRVTAGFNLLAKDELTTEQETLWRKDAEALLSRPENIRPSVLALSALALWRDGRTEAARQLWVTQWTRDQTPAALAALLLSGVNTPTPPSALQNDLSPFAVLYAARSTTLPTENDRLLQKTAERLFATPAQQAP
jgi:hypothetical protein